MSPPSYLWRWEIMIAGVVGRTTVACGDGDGPYGHGHGDDGSVGRWRSLLVDVVWTTFVGNDVPAIILFDMRTYIVQTPTTLSRRNISRHFLVARPAAQLA